MESSNSLQEQLKKISHEVSTLKTDLHLTQEHLKSILQNSDEMIFAIDVEGALTSFSMGGEEILGYKWKELEGTHIKDLAWDPSSFEKFKSTSLKGGKTIRKEVSFRHKEGHAIYCDVNLINLNNIDGQIVGIIGICRDITGSKKLQEDLIRIDKLAEIGRMASAIIHDINNPIAVINEISGWAKSVVSDAEGLNQEDREELETAIERIGEQTERCKDITGRILGFVRESKPVKTSFDIHELLKETEGFVNPDLKHTRNEMVLDLGEEPLIIESDPKMLQQVFVNLMTNAIYAVNKKGNENGRVEVKTLKNGGLVKIIIADNGTGMSQKDQKKVFDLFYTSKPPGEGTGLGLPICQNIMKRLGGSISLESKIRKGTTFTVSLPES
jgi:PAS domain S-box-containing protein